MNTSSAYHVADEVRRVFMPCYREKLVTGITFDEGTILELSERGGKNGGSSGEKLV
jgi:hypothetical protein